MSSPLKSWKVVTGRVAIGQFLKIWRAGKELIFSMECLLRYVDGRWFLEVFDGP